MKRLIAFIIVGCLMLSLLAGCKNDEKLNGQQSSLTESTVQENFNTEGYPIVNEKITLKLMGVKAPIQGPWDQLLVFTEMEKITNVHFEFDTPSADSYNEKKNLAFASGDLPDVFFGGNLTVSDEIMYGGQGILIPLEKLVDTYAPNIKKLMDQNPEIKKSIITQDGHIYALPQIDNVPRDIVPTKAWINKQWLENVGRELPSTIDDLYNVLKDFKDKDANKNNSADEIPLTFDKTSLFALRGALLPAFGILNMYNELNPGSRVDLKDGTVRYVPVQPEYKEYIKFMNKLFSEELIDNEAYIQTAQQVTAKGNEGKLGAFAGAAPFLVVKMEDNENYVAVPPLTSTVNNKKVYPKNPGISRGAFAITKNNAYPEATIRWIDYFYSPEGGAFLSQGPENVGWKWKDDSKTLWEKIPQEGYANTEEFRGGKITPNCGTLTPGLLDADFILKLNAAHVLYLEKEIGAKYMDYLNSMYPLVYFTDEEQKRLVALESDLNKYIDQMEARFINGDASIDMWDEYLSTITKMGVDEVVKIYQAAYDRWESAK